MPTSPSSSIDSQPPFARAKRGSLPPLPPLAWGRPLVLFIATLLSVLYTGAARWGDSPSHLRQGLPYAVPLLSILLTHEFGHFIFARVHRVSASLPMFIPAPLVSPFGTAGAVIVMKDQIKSRNALLDIGAAGPLAGMAVAIPVLLFGLAHSEVKPLPPQGDIEGQCLLYSLLKWIVLGPIPAGWDVEMNAAATAGWVGLFVTMLNLLPTGQLDGGHIAYALFGQKQQRYSRIVRYAMLALFVLNAAGYMAPALWTHDFSSAFKTASTASTLWLGWFVVLTVLMRLGGSVEHPPTEPSELSPGRRIVAVASLVLFALIFMPTPWRSY